MTQAINIASSGRYINCLRQITIGLFPIMESGRPPFMYGATKRTRLASAVLDLLGESERPLATRYDILGILLDIFQTATSQKLFRKETIGKIHIRRVIRNLVDTQGMGTDIDYGRNVYRVLTMGDVSAEEAFSLVTPFGYVSHLSAMHRWGLTERRPLALHLTLPSNDLAQRLAAARMGTEFSPPFDQLPAETGALLTNITPPAIVRGREVTFIKVKQMGAWLLVRGSPVRLATVGQTFHDMLDRPDLCGGMVHIRDVWREHATTYLDEIINAINQTEIGIIKVRAGYLLDEVLGLGCDARILAWLKFAQRGGSRVLDPSKPFAPTYSQKWMLSINV